MPDVSDVACVKPAVTSERRKEYVVGDAYWSRFVFNMGLKRAHGMRQILQDHKLHRLLPHFLLLAGDALFRMVKCCSSPSITGTTGRGGNFLIWRIYIASPLQIGDFEGCMLHIHQLVRLRWILLLASRCRQHENWTVPTRYWYCDKQYLIHIFRGFPEDC